MKNKNEILLLNEVKKKRYISPTMDVCGGVMLTSVNVVSPTAEGPDIDPDDDEEIGNHTKPAKTRFYNELDY